MGDDVEEGEIDDETLVEVEELLPGVEIPIEDLKSKDDEDVIHNFLNVGDFGAHLSRNKQPLSHAEKWDDSVLIEAWDSAVEQYRVRLFGVSIYAKFHVWNSFDRRRTDVP